MSVGEEEKRRMLYRHRRVSFMVKTVAATENECVTTPQWLVRDGAQSITVDDDDEEASVASACVLATMLVKISSI